MGKPQDPSPRWETIFLKVAIWVGIVILVGVALSCLILWWEWSVYNKEILPGKPVF